MRTVLVRNLRTMQEVTYYNDLSIEQNCINAYMYFERGDKNWWGYRPQPLHIGAKTVACGEWCACKEQ